MNLVRSFQPTASAPVARERLQILLEYDRKLGSQIDLFTVLREEILAVVSRHIVDPEKVQVSVDRGAKFSTLGVNIEIPNPGGRAQTLPTDCPVLHRDKTVGTRGLRINKGQMKRGVDRAGIVALITSLFGVGLLATVVLGAWLYVQQRETALMAGFEEQVNAVRPAEGVVAAIGPSVVLPRISGPGTSLPRDPAAPEPVSQSAAITPVDAPGGVTAARKPPPAAAELATVSGNVTSSPHEPPPVAAEAVVKSTTVTGSVMSPPQDPQALREPAAVHPALQSAAVAPPATLGSANELPTAPSQEPPPGSVTPLPPRRPLQIPIATPPRTVPPPALLRRREAP
jgi:cell division topological specificity factor